jgi:hypothetical protein
MFGVKVSLRAIRCEDARWVGAVEGSVSVWSYAIVLLVKNLNMPDKSTDVSAEFIGDEAIGTERKAQKYQVSGTGEGR